jgi:regulator of protease activity HflC (stomatin/prohibitin superfamily)
LDSTQPASPLGLRRWLLNRSSSGSPPDPADRLRQRFEEALRGAGVGGGRRRPRSQVWRWIAIVVFGYILIRSTLVVVPNGACGVVFSDISGVQQRALGPGLNVVVPFVTRVTIYSTQRLNYTMSRVKGEGDVKGDDRLNALTSDGQLVDLDITVSYHVAAEDAWKLHRNVGISYERRIIRPEARSVVRMVCAQHPVADFTSSKRDEIRQQISDRLRELFTASHITLEDITIREVEFSQDFRAAVEQKQQVVQEVEAMEYRIRETKTEAERKIVEAEKNAAWILERGKELERNPLVIQYEYAGKIAPNIGGLMVSQEDIKRITAGAGAKEGVGSEGRDVQQELDQLLQAALTESSPAGQPADTTGGEAR